jgi:hypothetical protein
MISFEISDTEINKLLNVISDKIAAPILETITNDTKSKIHSLAKSFKGVSEPSISSNAATQIIFTKYLSSEIKPISTKLDVFQENFYGHLDDRYLLVTEKDGLKDWVSAKYDHYDREDILLGTKRLHIRQKTASGYPLGSPYRDFFGRAFTDILDNKSIYGLS